MASKVYGQAYKCKTIRESGVLDIYPSLKNTILITISHNIYILYKRESSTYYYVDLFGDQAVIVFTKHTDSKLSISQLINILESHMMEETHGS